MHVNVLHIRIFHIFVSWLCYISLSLSIYYIYIYIKREKEREGEIKVTFNSNVHLTKFSLMIGCLFGFYGISIFVGYLTPDPFYTNKSVLFQTIYLGMSTRFNCQKHFYFKLFSLIKQF